ncbi:MAG: prolyl oligopeptidase family serine peptidase [Vicinamibacterales bacterium]
MSTRSSGPTRPRRTSTRPGRPFTSPTGCRRPSSCSGARRQGGAPNQSAMMAEAARRKGLPVAYITYEGEQHGFRKAENIVRSLEAELYFYGRVFGFTPADPIEPVAIDNLP